MNELMSRWERMFAAAGLAEEGEREMALEMLHSEPPTTERKLERPVVRFPEGSPLPTPGM
ncbi:MAG: hypothetical protein HQL56_11230 [Magnetococcales bacterium]|nr:hypothetical protein [Magnetococcales bacterium]